MKRTFCFVILVVLFLASGGRSSELPDFPFVYATGQGEIEVPPDVATITFRIEAFDKNPASTAATVEERSRELLSLFAKYGIDKKDIIAYELSKKTVRERKDYTELGILGYETSRRFSVKIHTLKEYGHLIAALLDVKNLTNLNTEFDTTRRKVIEAELIGHASARAREQAEALAKGFGSEISSVFAITTSSMGFLFIAGQFGLGRDMEQQLKGETAQPSIFVPSTIKLQKAVTAIFKLKV